VPVTELYRLLSIQDKDGRTVVHWAVDYGYTEILQCMVQSLPAPDLQKLIIV